MEDRLVPFRTKVRCTALIGASIVGTAGVVLAQGNPATQPSAWVVDFRYAPPWWQTSICLPDDWQKTLVAKDGGLLYDYPGKYAEFKTKITAGLDGGAEWVRQELVSPRVPIVRTLKRSGSVELEEEAFAVPAAPGAEPYRQQVTVERVGSKTTLVNWASPTIACDPAFRNIAVGWGEPIRYRFQADKAARYTVVFGLCEGHHSQTGQRVVDLQIEGKTRKTVDPIAEKGRNIPVLFAIDATDVNGDGWIDVAVSAAAAAGDKNTILNTLWVFREADAPVLTELLAGGSSKSALVRLGCGEDADLDAPPRNDILILRLRNGGAAEVTVDPTLTIESERAVTADWPRGEVVIGAGTTLLSTHAPKHTEESAGRVTLHYGPVRLLAGARYAVAIGVTRGARPPQMPPQNVAQAATLRKQAEAYWKKLDLPYGHIVVPDAGIQAIIDSSIRNIYQAREIKKGLPAFQVGPTCYRGLWVVDGSFLMEAVTFLGRVDEARNGIRYLLSFQRKDGAILLMDGHWKETGIALWAVTRHARLTDDKAWLREVWPNVERGFAFIRTMRQTASADPKAPNAGLIPAGMSDGGLGGTYPEYTNVYWTLAGMHAAIEAARWLDKGDEAKDWQAEYDDFYATFRKAAERDMRTDAHGNRYLPIRMRDDQNASPQKAQWAFLHAIFPGKVFKADDPLVKGNMAMLKAVEQEGLVLDTGWVANGIWNYFASFYAHAWLWLGQGQKAAQTLYAFANHASPLLAWREEQMPVGKPPQYIGDMPHNWASAEFIRLARHLLVLERGDELHLFEGLPPTWARPGAVTRLKDIVTVFGPMSLELNVDKDGKSAHLQMTPPSRTKPAKIVLHLDGWSGREGTIELPAAGQIERDVELKAPASR